MKPDAPGRVGQPLARYASWKRAGDIVYFSGVIAVEPASGRVLESFADVPAAVRAELGETGRDAKLTKDCRSPHARRVVLRLRRLYWSRS